MSKTIRMITIGALIVALDVVFARLLYFYTPGNLDRISPQFLAQGMAGYIMGPLWAMVCTVSADFLGMLVNGAGLSFSPFFTLSALLRGPLYAMVLYRRPWRLWRTVVAVAVQTLVIDLGLNSLWISLTYGNAPWHVIMLSKLPIRLVTIPVYAAIFFFVGRALGRARIQGFDAKPLFWREADS